MIHCWIIEVDNQLEISPGDGQAVSIGKWVVRQGSTIDVSYRLVYEAVLQIGGTYPGPEKRATATIGAGGRIIVFGGEEFTEASRLASDSYEKYIGSGRAKLH